MAKFKGMDYKDLDNRTKQVYKAKLNQLHKVNLTISSAMNLSNTELASKLGLVPRSKNRTPEQVAETYKRVYKQIRATKERRENTIDLAWKAHKPLGYTKKLYNDVKIELIKVAGNSFTYLTDIIANKYPKDLKKNRTKDDDSWIESNEYVKGLLLLSKKDQAKLSQPEKDLLAEFSP